MISKFNKMFLIVFTLFLSFSNISSSDEVTTLDATLEKSTLGSFTSNETTTNGPEALTDIETQIVELLKGTNTSLNVNVAEVFKKTNGLSNQRSDLILIILLTLLQQTNELTVQTNDLMTRTSALTVQMDNLLTRTNDLSAQINNLSTRTNDLTTGSVQLMARTNELTIQTNNLTSNPVPIGFVYVQYPEMPTPATLWPSVTWTQITSNYAGLFFRAEGGTSNPFTSGIQGAQSPRITRVEFTGNHVGNSNNVGLSYNANEFTSSWYHI